MNIYIGNLSPEVAVEDLRHAFEPFGRVADATIIRDKVTGASRGFGFVKMPNEAEADAAISSLNRKLLIKGQRIFVKKARPRGWEKAERTTGHGSMDEELSKGG